VSRCDPPSSINCDGEHRECLEWLCWLTGVPLPPCCEDGDCCWTDCSCVGTGRVCGFYDVDGSWVRCRGRIRR
jgi:hypothetical protein